MGDKWDGDALGGKETVVGRETGGERKVTVRGAKWLSDMKPSSVCLGVTQEPLHGGMSIHLTHFREREQGTWRIHM